MRLTLATLEKLADEHDIEISQRHRADGERYQVIQCYVPAATEYGCKDLDEVHEAILEIIEQSA